VEGLRRFRWRGCIDSGEEQFGWGKVTEEARWEAVANGAVEPRREKEDRGRRDGVESAGVACGRFLLEARTNPTQTQACGMSSFSTALGLPRR
jgi:hypothetical protein